MPERRDSVDSFDDFFGVPKTDDTRKKSPAQRKQSNASSRSVVKSKPQSIEERSRTPTSPVERRNSSPKPKVSNSKVSSASKDHKEAPSEISNRTGTSQSKAYESDFDNENDFEDDETVIESTNERNKTHGSLPPTQKPTYEAPRRGSDSELKRSFTTSKPPSKPKSNGPVRTKEPALPYIRPQQTRRTGAYPVHRRRNSLSSIAKHDTEERASSARNNKIKTLESRLAELRRELENQRIENATLRTIQRREEKAIKKYEEKEYDIHRIVRDFSYEIDHMKEILINERETKAKLEQQIEKRNEKLREHSQRLKKYEKIVQEKNLEERHELREKLNETEKRLQEIEEKLSTHEKYVENLEKNHRHELQQELMRQRELKRQVQTHSAKYNDLLLKYEERTRQIETMHIYAQRAGKQSSLSPSNLGKSHSLQSLNETSPRMQDKLSGHEKKRREQQEREKKSKPKQRSSSNDFSSKAEKKTTSPRRTLPNTTTTNKNSSNDDKSSTTQNGHLPPKGKPAVRRLSTPKSVEEEKVEADDEDIFGARPKKLPPPTTNQRNNEQSSHAHSHKRPAAPVPSTSESKQNSTGTGGTTSSSIFKLTEPPALSKPRATRPLDEKWSSMFDTNEKEDSTKEDLLAKLVADEQQERRAAAAQPSSQQRPTMSMFESATRTTTTQPTTSKPSNDPFESLFSNNKPTTNRTNDSDDIFSTKPSNNSTAQNKNDPFESLFGPSSKTDNSNSKTYSSQNDKLQRPKVVTNATKPTPNRTLVDEIEEFNI